MKKIVCTMASLLILASVLQTGKRRLRLHRVNRLPILKSCVTVPGFEELSLNKRIGLLLSPKLRYGGIYFMTKTENGTWPFAALSEAIYQNYTGDRESQDFKILEFI